MLRTYGTAHVQVYNMQRFKHEHCSIFQEARGFTCVTCASNEILAVLIVCFESIACEQRKMRAM